MLKVEELGSALAMSISSFSPAGAPPSQSLRMVFGEISPRMEQFSGVAMEIEQVHPLLHGLWDSLHAETDGDRLILGSFSCKRVKVIAIILSCKENSHVGLGTATKVRVLQCWARSLLGDLGQGAVVPQVEAAEDVFHAQEGVPLAEASIVTPGLSRVSPSVPQCLPPRPQLHLGLSCCQLGVQPLGRPQTPRPSTGVKSYSSPELLLPAGCCCWSSQTGDSPPSHG